MPPTSRLYRAGELVAVRIPSEADERVRDVVRCRETFQREILKSRHYLLKFLATRGFVFREGTNWCTPHLKWLQHLTTDNSPLAPEDRLVYREYHALLLFKLQRREELDRQIERLAELPTLAPMGRQLQCFRGISRHSAMVLATELVDWRRFERPSQLACDLGSFPGKIRAETGSDSAPSPRQAIVIVAMSSSKRRGIATVGTCSCKPRGATGIGRKRASISSAGSKGNRPR